MKMKFGIGMVIVAALIALITVDIHKLKYGYEGVLVPVVGTGKSDISGMKPMDQGWNFWAGWKYDMVTNPNHSKKYVWTAGPDKARGSEGDEAISFQDKDKLTYTADVGLQFKLKTGMTGPLYAEIHKSVDEMIDTFLLDSVAKHMGDVGGSLGSDGIIGEGRESFAAEVEDRVRKEWGEYFHIEDVFFIGPIDPPASVEQAIAKAAKKRQEVITATAEKEKKQQATDAFTYDKRQKDLAVAAGITAIADAEEAAIKKIKLALDGESYTGYLNTRKWNGSKATTILGSDTQVIHNK